MEAASVVIGLPAQASIYRLSGLRCNNKERRNIN